MTFFLLVFLGIYTTMHLLVWWGVSPLLPTGSRLWPALLLWCGAMIAAPPAARLLERCDWETFARVVSWVGYLWLGFVFLAFCGFLLIGIWDGVGALLARSFPLPGLPRLHGAMSAAVVLTLTLGGGLYALYEARQLQTEEVHLTSDHLPAALHGLRVVQLSDIHLGLINRTGALTRITRIVRELQPDLIVATGDIVDAQIDHLDGMSYLLRDLPARLGKFAVLGNHEFYAGLPDALAFINQSGFQLLRNQSRELYPGFIVVGVDDPAGRRRSEEEVLLSGKGAGFVLLLKHRPEVASESLGAFDLQLSGHAHRGQIFPFNLLTRLRYPLQDGLYPLQGRGHLYTSRGTGTWGPPMRLFSPPEITLFVLERSSVDSFSSPNSDLKP